MKLRLLAVDDEPSNLEEIEDLLAQSGLPLACSCFTNPLAALEAAHHQPFDAALLDIQMPAMTGLELAEQLANLQPAMETVFITAYNHYATEAFELNAVDYLLKPIRQERFTRAMQRLLERIGQRTGSVSVAAPLRIYTLGGLGLFRGEEEITWNRPKIGELFAYMLLHAGRQIHKERICEDLWPDLATPRALANLQVTMSRLRKVLAPFEWKQLQIAYSDDCYSLQLSGVYHDAGEFEDYLQQTATAALEKALSLYTGTYLGEKGWPWADQERERLRRRHARAVAELARLYLEEGAYSKAELLLADYLNKEAPAEHLAALYLEAAARAGGRAGLKSAYVKIKKVYQKELGLQVPAELQQAYTRLGGS